MQKSSCSSKWHLSNRILVVVTAVLLKAFSALSVAVPSTNCYAFDNSSRLVDFSSWIGHPFEYDGKESDLVVRFCKDIETRSQTGYIDFGRFDTLSYFEAGQGSVDFVQGFYHGDLTNCEQSYDKLGRTTQVNLICGNCADGRCKGGLGCICSVSFESTCRAIVELAIPCEKPGPRVFAGFTVGFHPRSWEVVYNGMTQLGFEKPHRDFSFKTEQTHLTLYMTSIASVSKLVGKPLIKVFPEDGLEVKLSGSGSHGNPPTTLSPTALIVDWKCNKPRESQYEVNITIPIEGYEPIQFFLAKLCKYRQEDESDSSKGWAIFGVFSCVFLIGSMLFCCGGFIYKTKVERMRGIDALPGMSILSALLETASGAGQSYPRAEDINNAFAGETSWDQQPSSSAQATWKPAEKKYGSI